MGCRSWSMMHIIQWKSRECTALAKLLRLNGRGVEVIVCVVFKMLTINSVRRRSLFASRLHLPVACVILKTLNYAAAVSPTAQYCLIIAVLCQCDRWNFAEHKARHYYGHEMAYGLLGKASKLTILSYPPKVTFSNAWLLQIWPC